MNAPAERTVRLCGESVPHPGHVCAFFDSREQKYETLIPFFIDAIEAGDRVINVVDAANLETHLKSLEAGNVPVRAATENGQLNVLTSEETYLQAGAEGLDGMLDMLRDELESAKREERCLRTCGEMGWIGRTDMPVVRVLEYEARVNELLPSHTCTLLCIYDLASTRSALISDILATHPYAIVNGRLRPNPYHVAPAEYLQMISDRENRA